MKREDFIDTVLHEIAHMLAPAGHGHGRRWKRIAKRLGAEPKAYKDLPYDADVKDEQLRWRGKCASGHVFFNDRREKRSCAECNPRDEFDPLFLISWEPNPTATFPPR
jgi:predicted SprT family Zn-dependent metalloprotease